MEEKKIRNLEAEEIECRVGTISEKGLSLLLYKDARVDQNILDSTFGIFGWTRKHEKIGESLYCTVSVRDENGNWISKQDVGTESYAEAIKGAASDSFKRACFNFGIGRELYTAPFIWISSEKVDIRHDGKRYVTKDSFRVTEIEYDNDKNIIALNIANQRGDTVYSYRKKVVCKNEETPMLSHLQRFKLDSEMQRTGVTEKDIIRRYQITSIQNMSQDTYEKVMKALEKTKDLAA